MSKKHKHAAPEPVEVLEVTAEVTAEAPAEPVVETVVLEEPAPAPKKYEVTSEDAPMPKVFPISPPVPRVKQTITRISEQTLAEMERGAKSIAHR
jgi:hypothetical protein